MYRTIHAVQFNQDSLIKLGWDPISIQRKVPEWGPDLKVLEEYMFCFVRKKLIQVS